MRKLLATALCLLFCHGIAAQTANEELETVVVTGEVPGPGLWKVTKGDHVMWVLATHSPLPKGLTWRSAQIEVRIAESQELLYAPRVKVRPNIGMVREFALMPAAMQSTRLPDGKTLKDVLPPADYARWSALREKYMPGNADMDRLRPEAAMVQLRNRALWIHGLQGGPNVNSVVYEARKKHKVRPVLLPAVERTFELKNIRAMLEGAQKVEHPDVACFNRNLDRIEADVERMKVLANAWSLGDIGKLRSLFRQVKIREAIREYGCVIGRLGPAVMNVDDLMTTMSSAEVEDVKKAIEDSLWHVEQAMAQAQLDWLAAAQAALAKNRSTFAVLGLSEVLAADGHLEKLRALGYTVEEPG